MLNICLKGPQLDMDFFQPTIEFSSYVYEEVHVENRLFLKKARGTSHKIPCHHPKCYKLSICIAVPPYGWFAGVEFVWKILPSDPCIEVCADKTQSTSCVSREHPSSGQDLLHWSDKGGPILWLWTVNIVGDPSHSMVQAEHRWENDPCSTISQQMMSRKLFLEPY